MAAKKTTKKKVVSKKTDQKKPLSQNATTVLAVMVAVVSGFFGGWFGARADIVYDSPGNLTIQRELINGEENLINTIASDVGPSVVSVNVKSVGISQDFFGFAKEIEQESAGTGIILNKEGLIITNRHVVPQDTSQVSITLSNGVVVEEVEIVGRTNTSDPLDIAFLKIKDASGLDLVPAILGDSSKVEVGNRVVAIGNALGQFQNTVTSGIISGFGRDIEAYDGSSLEPLQNLFQTDAAINGGNSGGPLVNSISEVIAINVATAGADNISFAIPINDVKGLIDIVLEEGRLVRPYLGIRYVSLTDDIAFDLDLPVNRGAYIPEGTARRPSIFDDSPAKIAGLMEEDIIVELDGTQLDEKTSVVSVLGQKRVGDTVDVKINRGGEEITLQVTLEALEE